MTHEADTLGPTERDQLLNEIANLNAELAMRPSGNCIERLQNIPARRPEMPARVVINISATSPREIIIAIHCIADEIQSGMCSGVGGGPNSSEEWIMETTE